MVDLGLILLGALLVNNFVLAQFLGLCPFMGTTGTRGTALPLSLATCFVLTLSAALCHLIYHGLLLPLGLEYLQIILFIVAIAAVVQFTELFIRNLSPVLHRVLGIYLPLITSNCAVLAVALLAVNARFDFIRAVVFALGAAAGFTLVLVLFAALRERIDHPDVPAAFRGAPLALVSAGIMSLAFSGFAGFGNG
jgi:electron transport complex protein RnfA